jgi:SAM-dependent methyltransferase
VRDDKFEFRLSPKNGTIPWQENSFDVVVSNFVMEHVGPQTAQQMHIREIARVLKPGGFCYLAVPNSWCVREAHTFLWFVTWMPEAWQEPYVCWRTKRKRFGTWTPSRRSVRRMCRHVGLNLRATTIDTMRDYAALEPVGRLTRWICRSPTLLLRSLMGMVPSMTFILEKPRETARENHKDFTNQQPSQLHHSQT